MGMFRTDATTGGMLVKIVGTDTAVTLNVDDVSGLGVFNKPGETLHATVDGLPAITGAVTVADSPNHIISTTALTVGTVGVAVPAGTRFIMCYVPVLVAGTHTPAYIVDNATWVPFALEDCINGAPMPTTSIVAGRWKFQFDYVDANTKFRVTSTGDQAGKPIQVVFER